MQLTLKSIDDIAAQKSACTILPVFADGRAGSQFTAFDKATKGALKSAMSAEEFAGKLGETLLLRAPAGSAAERVVVLGLGKSADFAVGAFRTALNKLFAGFADIAARDALLVLADIKGADRQALLQQVGLASGYAEYRYTRTLSEPKPPLRLRRLSVACDGKPSAADRRALNQGYGIANGTNVARELGNLPANICTPSYLASQARALARKHKNLRTQVLGEKEMKELGMGSFLSVTAGTAEPAKLIVMEYRGAAASQAPYVLVGKGITFDSGGISLKPGAAMDEMKFDMGGAASVFGTMNALLDIGPAINVVGIVAAAENLPSGTATKPGDVVRSMAGITIEILNTDAEGRLVLCDALSYAKKYKPAAVVDIATLTGACVIALGKHASGLYANDDELAEQLLAAGTSTHDRAWRMPLWEDYQEQLKTNFADVANVGGREAGSVTAACFLARFTRDYKWAHLDIAGSAWDGGAAKGSTGRPVPLLTRWLLDRG